MTQKTMTEFKTGPLFHSVSRVGTGPRRLGHSCGYERSVEHIENTSLLYL